MPGADEKDSVSKTVPTILVIGALGAVSLSLMMQHLAEVKLQRERSPYAAAAEIAAGARLLGRVEIVAETEPSSDGEPVKNGLLTVRGRVIAGGIGRALAVKMGEAVWYGAMRAGERPRGVEVVLEDEDGEVACFAVPAPTAGR